MSDSKAGGGEPSEANAGEGADPAADIRKQNPGKTTTQDLAEGKHSAESEGRRK